MEGSACAAGAPKNSSVITLYRGRRAGSMFRATAGRCARPVTMGCTVAEALRLFYSASTIKPIRTM